MKNTTFTIFEAIGNADDDLIAETQEYPALVKTKKKKRSFRYKAIGAALFITDDGIVAFGDARLIADEEIGKIGKDIR